MVPNPPYHPAGDFALAAAATRPARLALGGAPRLTFGNIGALRHGAVPRTSARGEAQTLCRCLARLDRAAGSRAANATTARGPTSARRTISRARRDAPDAPSPLHPQEDHAHDRRQSPARFLRPAALRRDRAGARRARGRRAARRAARDGRAPRRDARPPTWDDFVAPLEDANERLDRAWGRCAHLNAVVNTPALREAYNAQPAEGHRVLHRARRRTSACSTSYGAAPARRSSPRSRRAAQGRRQRAARLPPGRRRAARRRRRRASRRSRRSCRAVGAVRGKRARRDQRLRALSSTTTPSSPAFPRTCSRGARARPQADGKPGWKFTLRMPCYLPVMQYADNRALRETLYRAYVDARLRVRASRVGQHPADRAHPRAAPRGRAAARLRQLRRGLAGAEDGAATPDRCSLSCATSRAARSPSPSATSPSSRRSRATSSAWPSSRPGTSPTRRKSCGAALRLLRPGSEAVLPRGPGARRPVPRGRDALRPRDPRGEGAGLAPGRALLRRSPTRDGALRRPVLPRPLRARQQARRRVDGRRDQPPARRRRACRCRWPTSTATSPRRSAASPRCSPTTK